MSIFCSSFANLLNYKKEGEVCKKHPCDPPKSRVTGGGCHRDGYLEAGLKQEEVVTAFVSFGVTEMVTWKRVWNGVTIGDNAGVTIGHRDGYLEAGLKQRENNFGIDCALCHRDGYLEAGLKRSDHRIELRTINRHRDGYLEAGLKL